MSFSVQDFLKNVYMLTQLYVLLEVKWALESITTNKASGGDGIPVELF